MLEMSYFPVVVNSDFADQIKEEYAEWLVLEVGEPVTITTREHIARSTTVTTYLVRIETNHVSFVRPFSAVRRRYSEFCWLRTTLAQNYPKEILPPLPPKKVLKFNPKVIEDRCTGLTLFLQRILQKPAFLVDPALHLFLQTEMTVEEIDRKISQQALRSTKYVRQTSCSSEGSTGEIYEEIKESITD